MLYLIWALLNIAILVFLILACIKATKLIREKFGLFAAIVFVIGLLSFVVGADSDQENKQSGPNQMTAWKFTPERNMETNSTRFQILTLQRNLISGYELVIRYGKNKQDQLNTPVDANSWTIGLVTGTKWKPSSIIINKTEDNNRFQYSVNGTVEWKLLGITIFSQPKEYNGTASIK